MKQRIIKIIIGIAVVFLSNLTLLFSQTITLAAGTNQTINWEKTYSTQLKGDVSSNKIKVEWTCPQNSNVVFKNASKPLTEVTFPRPCYFLLILSGKGTGNDTVSSFVIVNAIKPNSYRERLSDLISLMTVDEKINQLTNQADSIRRLSIPGYNSWNEALHGVLASGVTSFPQAVELGSTWDPDLVYRVATAFYASTQQLPPISDYDLINHPHTYVYFDDPVLFPFGHGLSYTQFEYSNITLDSDKIKKDDEVEIQFTVQNTGQLTGDEIVKVNVHDLNASIKVPINQLKRFQRISLAPGESKKLTIKIPISEFSFYDIKTNDFKTELGQWEIQVGSSSKDIRLKKLLQLNRVYKTEGYKLILNSKSSINWESS